MDVNLTSPGASNETPLHTACRYNYSHIVQKLLTCTNINVNKANGFPKFQTPLQYAISFNSMDCIKVLVAFNGSVNRKFSEKAGLNLLDI